MRIERLVAMANDIATFFECETDRAAGARAVAAHLRRFWDPRMRREILAHLGRGGAGLSALAREALTRLASD